MVEEGLNQAQLAKKMECTTGDLCYMLNGQRTISKKNAQRFEEVLGIPALVILMMQDMKELNII